MKYVLSILLFLISSPVFAQTCSVTFRGEKILSEQPCDVTVDENVVTIEQGNYLTIEIANGVAKWNGANEPHRGPDDPKAYELRLLGEVVAMPGEDGLCWVNKSVLICYSGLDPD